MQVVSDEGDGPETAVLLHGQPGRGSDFVLVRQALRGSGLRVVTVDRPGYDGTPATGYAGNARQLGGLLDRLGVAAARVLGFSWSGGVALAFGRAYPDRCAGLVLAAGVGGPGSIVRGDRLLALPGAGRLVGAVLPRLGILLERSSGSHLDPAARALGTPPSRADWAAFTVEQRAMMRDTEPLWAGLRPPPYPVRLVHGTRDGLVPIDSARRLARRLSAPLTEVDAGHLLHLEVPALLAAELRALGSP